MRPDGKLMDVEEEELRRALTEYSRICCLLRILENKNLQDNKVKIERVVNRHRNRDRALEYSNFNWNFITRPTQREVL